MNEKILLPLINIAILSFLFYKRKLPKQMFLLLILLNVISFGLLLQENLSGREKKIDYLPEEAIKSGHAELEIQQGQGERQSIELQIQKQIPPEERKKILEETAQEIDTLILGNNTSFEKIEYDLNLPVQLRDGQVQVQWTTDRPAILTWDGRIQRDLPKAGTPVKLAGELTLEDQSLYFERKLTVFPSKEAAAIEQELQEDVERMNRKYGKGRAAGQNQQAEGEAEEGLNPNSGKSRAADQNKKEEQRYSKDGWKEQERTDDNDSVNDSGQMDKQKDRKKEEEWIQLPDTFRGESISWYQPAESSGGILTLLTTAILPLLLLNGKQKEEEKRKKRKEALEYAYPELVSKILLFTGAGLSMRNIFERLAADYQRQKKRGVKEKPVYEEILQCKREFEHGLSEITVYKNFGERCGTASYRGLALLLEQNLQKGGRRMRELLELQMREALEKRRRMAREEGEKTQVKMAIPMMLMLLIVMVLLIIPAVFSF